MPDNNTTGAESPLDKPTAGEWLTPGRFALLLGLLIAATFPRVLMGVETLVARDFGLFGYPLASFHREAFWRGEMPLWNPLNSCGVPFLAQWNTLTLYPPSLIYLLLPLTWSLSFFCLAHQFWGGLGMYFLAHRWTNHRLAAGLAGVIFSFNGLVLNFLQWPNNVAAFAWLPWVVLLAQPAWRDGGRKLVCAALASAMQLLAAGPEIILSTWLLLFLLAGGDWGKRQAPRGKLVVRFLGLGLISGIVCAAQLLPFLQLLAHSQRDTGFGASDWAMPLWGWANFLVPLFRMMPTSQGWYQQVGQYWTTSYYAGVATVLLAVLAIVRVRDWRVRLLAATALVALVLALGDSGWLYRGLRFCFPGLGFARYPVKFVILVLAVAPLLAAFGYAAWAEKFALTDRFVHRCLIGIVVLIAGIVLLDRAFPLPDTAWRVTVQNGLIRVVLLVLFLVAACAYRRSTDRRRILLGCLLLGVVWLDCITHMPRQNPTVPAAVYTPGWASAQANWNPRPQPGQSRVMLAGLAQQALRNILLPDPMENYLLSRRAFFADCNLLEGVPQVYGFFSLVPREAHRTTMLPYVHPKTEFPALLDFMGVGQTTAFGKSSEWVARPTAMPIVTAGQRPVFADDKTAFDAFYQTNMDFRETVFLPPEASGSIAATQRTSARVLESRFTPQRISIRAEAAGPGLVVIAQTFYPVWRASVDGQPAKIWRANYAFQAVEIPAGTHAVELIYRDNAFRAGLWLSGLGLLICAGMWWWSGRTPSAPSAGQPST